MPGSSSWTDVAAFWGAFSGSIAVIIQGALFFKDRAKLMLSPRMSITSKMSSNPVESMQLIDFEVEVVNVGRRIAVIEEVGIKVKGKKARFWGKPAMNLIIYPSDPKGELTQLTEGHKKTFELRRWQGTENNIAEAMAPSEKVYVKLTSGQVLKKKFKTVSLSQLEELKRDYENKV